MKKEAAKQLVTETFDSSFDKEKFTYFVKNLFKSIDPATFTYRGNTIRKSYQEYIKTLTRVGKYTDPESNKLDILIVQLQKETSLERARTMQRNFIAWYLTSSRSYAKDAAVVAFVAPNQEDWRFSLVKMEYDLDQTDKGKVKIKKELTPARRWSFLVGEHENTHTARKQLLPLLTSDEKPTLTNLEDAFDIEVVTKEFFEKYRNLYHKVKDALDKVAEENEAVRRDFEEKNVETVDFAKKLLGQIVFLYFLQKKGWFGVARDADWGTGPKDFLRRLFEGKLAEYDNFFNDILEPLFYEALAVERPDDYYSRFNCKIPFLNGGLFDPIFDYNWVHTDINLPNELFSNKEETKEGDIGTGILDIFDRYNFTVKEDEPLEKEVAIDPEMLGKVFENLLEVKDRKSKGTYYTPREIVHYMCQESLINYLATGLAEEVESDKEDELKEAVRILVEHGESLIEHEEQVEKQDEETETYTSKMPELIKENADFMDEKLADIKVCDPAVGSGAFPVGMMKEIVSARRSLTNLPKNGDRTTYEFKRQAIQNSLYGVDIDPGAVEIAKLRLWLSLIVDEESRHNIRALPNLDYKIMQGNSLLSEYEGIKLDIDGEDKPEQGKFEVVKTETERLTDQLQELRSQFFKAKHKSEKDGLKKKIEVLTWDLIETALKEQGKEDKLEEIKEFKKSNTKPFFLWHLNFSEVFEEKQGFDIVIGNPPYVSHDKIDPAEKLLLKNNYESYEPFADYYCFFVELGIRLLNSGGVTCFITSNAYLKSNYGQPLRILVLKKGMVKAIINLPSYQVFDEPIVNTAVLLFQRIGDAPKETSCYIVDKALPSGEIFARFVNKSRIEYQQKYLDETGWTLASPEIAQVRRKIEKAGPTLESWDTKIRLGLATGANYAFVIDEKTRNRLVAADTKNSEIIKPIIGGRDIFRYGYSLGGKYIILAKNGIDIEKEYPSIYRYLDSFGDKLKNRGARGRFWYNLRACAFFDDFKEEKVIWIELTDRGRFAYSRNELYLLNSAYFLIAPRGLPAKFLLGVLNSKVINFYLDTIAETSGMGTNRWINNFVKEFPIPKVSRMEQLEVENVVDGILSITDDADYTENSNKQAQVKKYEEQIDQLVYKLYNLTPEEIEIVEGEK